MKRMLLAFLFCGGVCALYADYKPVPGTEDVYDLVSPLFLAGGASVVSQESPAADALNPAAGGLLQRPVLEASYIGLASFRDDGWKGHAANLGASFPTRYGVVTGSFQFLHSRLDYMDLGNMGTFRLSFARDLYPDLLVGLGVHGTGGSGMPGGTSDFGVAADIGFLHIIEDMPVLADFRWGAAVRNLGKPYEPVDKLNYPAPFTPAVGMGFGVFRSAAFSFGIITDFSFPFCQDVRANVGGEIGIQDWLSINVSSRFDVRQRSDEDIPNRRLAPAFGITFVFKTDIVSENRILDSFLRDNEWERSEVKPRVAAGPLHEGIWAGGLGVTIALGVTDTTPPVIDIGPEEEIYISPNMDGVLDNLEIPLSITDERYVREYRFTVRDSSGAPVRVIENKEKRPENESLRGIIDRLFSAKHGIDIPSVLVWDGIGDSGVHVPDGNYSFTVEAKDDNGNHSITSARTFVVDTTPPEIVISPLSGADLIFSPDGDGSKDIIRITQRGSAEDVWEAKIVDAPGVSVRAFSWKNSLPASAEWDGKNDAGAVVPDGVYSYRVSCTDRAGNFSEAVLDNIIVNTQTTPVFLTFDAPYFSPNGDGFLDAIEFSVLINTTEGLEKWRLEIRDSAGGVRKAFTGGGAVSPLKVKWDGKGEDGSVFEDKYTAQFSAVYTQGSQPKASSGVFVLDVSPPEADINVSPVPFSPDNDGFEDELIIGLAIQDASPIRDWNLAISDRTAKVFNSFSGKGTPSRRIVWDGRSSTGELVLAAEDYPFAFTITDIVGNTRRVEGKIPVDILVIRDGERLKIRVSNINFAPDSAILVQDNSVNGQKNQEILARLVQVLTKYGNYTIVVEGHANNVSGTEREDVQELVPLSRKRAEAVREALVVRGLNSRRIEAEGKGGKEMLFPYSDKDNNWKNRRVEFILIK
ncbi:MAG: gliding motility-associated C-terminal domain-containing protein [Spirochaetales bacterium]|jgi:outer membrane protein OmpA-like peptidoglycan-associated protein/flagellar hook assembly protein FlgD|nr:gliding motility-associated C-terminal domain-containing protein [Spirochaetales bacterium]